MIEIKIYQLDHNVVEDERRLGKYIQFVSYQSLREMGFIVSRGNYNEVWFEQQEGDMATLNKGKVLNELYERFNLDHPDGFQGHSMSMSDVVVIGDRVFYCDSVGWREISRNQFYHGKLTDLDNVLQRKYA